MSDHDRSDHVPDPSRYEDGPPTLPPRGAPASGVEGFEEHGTPEQLAALYGALAAASGGFKPVVKNRDGQYKGARFKYATLEALIEATRPALAAEGVFIAQPPTRVNPESARACVRTIVTHKAGGKWVFLFEFAVTGDIQSYGTQVTYIRRYQYQATTGIDSGEPDADEMGDSQPATPAKNRQPPTQMLGRATRPIGEPSKSPPQREQPKPAPARQEAPAPAQRQADLERTLSTPVASNGSGAPVSDDGDPGPQPPPDMEEPEENEGIPADILAMDDATLKAALKGVAMELFGKRENAREAAQKRCIELVGKPREECTDRGDLERLLSGLRADLGAAS